MSDEHLTEPEEGGDGADGVDDVLLARAFTALRDTTQEGSAAGAATRTKILLAASATRRRTTRWRYVAIGLAAAFVASTAWAAATGRLPRLFDALGLTLADHERGAPPIAGSTSAPTMTSSTSTSTPTPAPTTTAPPATELDMDAASAQPDPSRATTAMPPTPATRPRTAVVASPTAAASPSPTTTTTTTTTPAPDAAADAEDALYAVAHRAHFVDKSPARALDAWDAYLLAYPRGRFALEARYNRGLDLVRLGRTQEARAALEPFARGDFNGYRKTEARAVLDAL